MYDLSEKTIYKHNANPLYTQHRFSDVSFNELVHEINIFKKKHGCKVPESEAIMFYLVNNILHTVKSKYNDLQELPQDVYDLTKKCDNISTRISKALFYHVCLVANGMLCIYLSTLESHQKDYFKLHYGEGFIDYLKVKNQNFEKMNIPNLTINQYLGGVSNVYSIGKLIAWGKPYSMIVKTAHKVSNGTYSLYTGADHIWSLCHNGGTVLNKGIGNVFSVASNYIFDILDVQDCGQIPAWIHEKKNKGYITKEIKEVYEEYYRLFPEAFAPFDSALLEKSTKKRVAAHAAMNAQYKQWWNTIYANNGQAVNNTPQQTVVQPKINDILIGDYKKNKWI